MKILPKQGILLIKKHKQTANKADVITSQDDEDKRLITGEVLVDGVEYKTGITVIFGRYAIYNLTINGEDFYLLDEEDVIGITEYKE